MVMVAPLVAVRRWMVVDVWETALEELGRFVRHLFSPLLAPA